MLLSATPGIEEIYGFARKEMTPILLYAAAFDEKISRIALIEPFSSYRSIVMNRFYHPGFVHNLVAGALTEYDLPDLAATLAPRKIILKGITDGNGEIKDNESIKTDMKIIRNAYQLKNAGENLKIISDGMSENMQDVLNDWK